MKLRPTIPSLLLFIGLFLLVGCSVEEEISILCTIEKVLVDEEIIVIKEKEENEALYKIPVSNIEHYEVGQTITVTMKKSENSEEKQFEIVN